MLAAHLSSEQLRRVRCVIQRSALPGASRGNESLSVHALAALELEQIVREKCRDKEVRVVDDLANLQVERHRTQLIRFDRC